jgi:hypothetical protein
MKKVTWMDKVGWKHVSWIRDNDDESMASQGIPDDPPNFDDIFEESKREFNNLLIDMDILCYNDLERVQSGLTSAILTILRSKVINRFKTKKHGGIK